MTKAKTKMQRVAMVGLLTVALALLAGCGGGNSEAASGGDGGSAPAGEPTRRALPTMPSARFAAPTTMITPEGGAVEVEATATLTVTEEITSTEEITE